MDCCFLTSIGAVSPTFGNKIHVSSFSDATYRSLHATRARPSRPLRPASRVNIVASAGPSPREIISEGFVSCKKCGADTPIDIRKFEMSKFAPVKVTCCQCRDKFQAEFNTVDVFWNGDIVKAMSIWNDGQDGANATAPSKTVKLFVTGIPMKVTSDQLNKAFSKYGSVEAAEVVKDRVTDRSRGFGFVTASSARDAQAMIDSMNNSPELGGNGVRVKLADER